MHLNSYGECFKWDVLMLSGPKLGFNFEIHSVILLIENLKYELKLVWVSKIFFNLL